MDYTKVLKGSIIYYVRNSIMPMLTKPELVGSVTNLRLMMVSDIVVDRATNTLLKSRVFIDDLIENSVDVTKTVQI